MMLLRTTFPRHSLLLLWPWLLGACMLVMASFMIFWIRPEMLAENARLDRQLQQLQLRVAAPFEETRNDTGWTSLAPPAKLSRLTADLAALSSQHGIVLVESTNQTAAPIAGIDLRKTEMSVRLKGAYLPLKKVVSAMLNAHPGLALESVTLQRNLATDTVLDLNIRLAIYHTKAQ